MSFDNNEIPNPEDIYQQKEFDQVMDTDREVRFQEREITRALETCKEYPCVYSVTQFKGKLPTVKIVGLGIVRTHLSDAGWEITQEFIRKISLYREWNELIWLIKPKKEFSHDKKDWNLEQEIEKVRPAPKAPKTHGGSEGGNSEEAPRSGAKGEGTA